LELFEKGKAKLVLNPQRLLEYIGTGKFEEERDNLESLEKLLAEKPRTFDELLSLSGLGEEELLERLTDLELERKIKSEGGYYIWIG